jgi:type II secretory pathway pseudopilin PulG
MTPHQMSVRPAPHGAQSNHGRSYHSSGNGFTLVELLIGLVVGTVSLGLAILVLINYIRTTDTAVWIGQAEQDFGAIKRFMKTEISEACLVQVSGSPSTTATLPATPCTPASANPCTTTSGTTLYLLVPITNANGTVNYRVISYSRSGNQLLRTGPPITTAGSLGTGADVANVVLMDNLSNSSAGFAPSVSPDCASATMNFSFAIPKSSNVLNRSLTVSAGSPSLLN